MLKIHRWFILVGLVFIVFISLSTDFKSVFMNNKFEQWVRSLAKEMEVAGISPAVIQQFKAEVTEPIEGIGQVVEANLYSLKIDEKLLLSARTFEQDNFKQLKALSDKYKIDFNIAVALMGYGSSFKADVPKYKLVNVLTTLSFLNQDSATYTNELLEFFKLVEADAISFEVNGYEDGGFTPLHIFPSLYANNMVDGNDDKQIDVINNNEDLLESAFNLLKNKAWEDNKIWGTLVKLPKGQNISEQQGATNIKSFKAWETFGITLLNKKSIPPSDLSAMLLLLDSQNNGILLYTNFSVIYNIKKDLQDSLTILVLSTQLNQYNKLLNYKKDNVKAMSKSQKLYQSKGAKKDDLPIPAKYRHLESIK